MQVIYFQALSEQTIFEFITPQGPIEVRLDPPVSTETVNVETHAAALLERIREQQGAEAHLEGLLLLVFRGPASAATMINGTYFFQAVAVTVSQPKEVRRFYPQQSTSVFTENLSETWLLVPASDYWWAALLFGLLGSICGVLVGFSPWAGWLGAILGGFTGLGLLHSFCWACDINEPYRYLDDDIRDTSP